MDENLVGYARCSTRGQDLRAQRSALKRLGVDAGAIHTDRGYTGRNRTRPGLPAALGAVGEGDTLVVTKLDRLGRSVTDLHAIAAELETKGARLSFGGSTYDPGDPAGKLFFTMLAAMAEFESDLIRARTREGVEIAKAEGRMLGRKPKLTALQHRKLLADHESGECSAAQLMEIYGLSRSAMYAALSRARDTAHELHHISGPLTQEGPGGGLPPPPGPVGHTTPAPGRNCDLWTSVNPTQPTKADPPTTRCSKSIPA